VTVAASTYALLVNEINPVLKRSKVQRDIANEEARIAKEVRHMRLEEMQRCAVSRIGRIASISVSHNYREAELKQKALLDAERARLKGIWDREAAIMKVQTHRPTYTPTRAHAYARTRVCARTHADACAHARTHTRVCTHTDTDTRTHAHAHRHMHTLACRDTHTRMMHVTPLVVVAGGGSGRTKIPFRS
jgi:hypothetical protein